MKKYTRISLLSTLLILIIGAAIYFLGDCGGLRPCALVGGESRARVIAPQEPMEKMLLVLAAPSTHDNIYADDFDAIVSFHIGYAEQVLELGNEDVVIVVDSDTREFYSKLPSDILVEADIFDIWMRDFTLVNPYSPVQFVYTDASMDLEDSIAVQKSFSDFADNASLKRKKASYILDGGNVVDNYAGRAILTTRFLEDNNLSYEKGKKVLRNLLNTDEVALIEADEDTLAHSDGMVMWVDDDILLVNDYSEFPELRDVVLDELEYSFPDIEVIEVPVQYTENNPGVWDGFSSACGVNVNSVMTPDTIYVPVFGMTHEAEFLSILERVTDKNIVTVDASGVCHMGGSVRCLTLQQAGENATKIKNLTQ